MSNDFEGNFGGNTFVAYMDISGFKELMKDDNAYKALDSFYAHAYRILKDYKHIYGIFISDCGIVYVNSEKIQDKTESLKKLLFIVKQINKAVVNDGFMLTTSIAYGDFQYRNKIVFERIEKNAIHGNAYLDAYLDNENGNPKIKPGQCRLFLSEKYKDIINEIISNNPDDEILNFLDKENNHYFFYWMIENPLEITQIRNAYNMAYELKYKIIKYILKNGTRKIKTLSEIDEIFSID